MNTSAANVYTDFSALASMREDGTLDALNTKWLFEYSLGD